MGRRHEQTFLQRRHTDDHQTHEKMLNITHHQIKTTMRDHLIHVRMTKIKNTRNIKCWWGCGEIETLVQYWWECKLVQPLWKTIWRFHKKLKTEKKIKNRTTIWSSNSTTGYLLKENENSNLKRCRLLYVYCRIIYNTQIMEVAQGSTAR